MPKTQHTPAPWKYEAPASVLIPVHNSQAGAEPIRLHLFSHPGENEANARLIAAAPEMLAALKRVVSWHREHDSGEGELFGLDFVTTCIMAIAHAEN